MQYQKLLVFIFSLIFVSLFVEPSFSQTLRRDVWATNGKVKAIAQMGNSLYLGGSFSHIGPLSGCGVQVDTATGKYDASYPVFNNLVREVKADGSGGWFVGGGFDSIGSVYKKGIVHLLSDGSIDPNFDVSIDGEVTCLLLSSDTLFIGGTFHNVNSQAIKYLAAVNKNTGIVYPWDTKSNGSIFNMAKKDSLIYVSGSFTNIGEQSRSYLAAVNTKTGKARTEWNPGNTVYSEDLEIYGSRIYVLKYKSKGLVGFDLLNATVPNWDPFGTFSPYSIKGYNGKLYVGGSNLNFNGVIKYAIAVIDTITGLPSNFNPIIYTINSNNSFSPGNVTEIEISDNKLYAAGNFKYFGAPSRINRSFAMSFDLSTETVTNWNPQFGNSVHCLAAWKNKIFIGGAFQTVNGVIRNCFAEVDLATGAPTPWVLELGGGVGNITADINTMKIIDSTLYMGGHFQSINGESRRKLAAINLDNKTLTSWNPDAGSELNSAVISMDYYNEKIYIGGEFKTMGGQSRNGLAAVNRFTGEVSAWYPNIYSIKKVLVYGDHLFIMGPFSNISGQSRNELAVYDLANETLTGLNPSRPAFTSLSDIYVYRDTLYVAGNFPNNIARMNFRNENSFQSWNPNITPSGVGVNGIHILDNVLYLGGNFSEIQGQSRKTLGSINLTTDLVTNWNPNQSITSQFFHYSSERNELYSGGGGNYLARGISIFTMAPSTGKVIVKGNVYFDNNKNCIKDTFENVFIGGIIKVTPGPYYTSVNSLGNYSIQLPINKYFIEQVMPVKQGTVTCPESGKHAVDLSNAIYSDLNFSYSRPSCVEMSVDISGTTLRRCARTIHRVSYTNKGSILAENVSLKIQFDKGLHVISSSRPWATKSGNTYFYNLGNVNPGELQSFEIIDSVICLNYFNNTTQCVKAWIYPASLCEVENVAWDRSSVEVTGECTYDKIVQFIIKNSGKGDMATSLNYRIYTNDSLSLTEPYKLMEGDSLVISISGHGETFRLEADQSVGHPGKSYPRMVVEGCANEESSHLFNQHFLTVLQNDLDPNFEQDCRLVVDSYDPNDKSVVPAGISANHYITDKDELEYYINFQNTGTAPAIKVVIKDTLSDKLDISTLEPGIASHPVELKVSGKSSPILEWVFNNINLPDSSRDNLRSQGFVKFRIKQKANNSKGTLIQNRVGIIFDFNDPVITNYAFNTVNDTVFSGPPLNIITVTNNIGQHKGQSIVAYPNPFSEFIEFTLPENNHDLTFELIDELGIRVISNSVADHSLFSLNRGNLKSGIYLYRFYSSNRLEYTGKIIIQ